MAGSGCYAEQSGTCPSDEGGTGDDGSTNSTSSGGGMQMMP
jgi:hypothetical protein